ncbi:ArsR family transcriptional regulator [Streptomyces diacarni]|uniref:ArsR family transcriptional regulator n=1 Tax=Streptomyces diacarni TaxID=2800381 RepID=A0A367E7J4_9ACTN|nr:helix-turn-helix domain-containing protein [Streptomyces diacarni]RCG13963.1 ArsR family transcriptional regulator [Streptomyces diacarni]
MANANELIHPVRMRILQTLLGADELTTAQLRDRLPDVASATMYRHVAALAQAGVIEVVSERPVRGTVERSYRVRQEQALVDSDTRDAMGTEDHRRAFTVFSAAVMGDFERYLSREDAEPAQENVLYRQGAVWVTDEEFASLVDEIEAAVARRTHTTPGDGRARHLLSLVFVPDKAAAHPDEPGTD